MAIKREKKRDGVFVYVQATIPMDEYSPEIEEAFEEFFDSVYVPERILDNVEKQLVSILSDSSRPKRKINKESAEREKHDAKLALERVGLIRKNLESNDARNLFVNSWIMADFFWKSKIRPLEPAMFHHGRLSNFGRTGNDSDEKQEMIDVQHDKWTKWQDEAGRIRADHPKIVNRR